MPVMITTSLDFEVDGFRVSAVHEGDPSNHLAFYLPPLKSPARMEQVAVLACYQPGGFPETWDAPSGLFARIISTRLDMDELESAYVPFPVARELVEAAARYVLRSAGQI